MSKPIVVKPPYTRRGVPTAYDAGWFTEEFGNIQRAIPSLAIKTIIADYKPTSLDHTLLGDASGGVFTVILPLASQAQGLYLVIKKTDASGNAITVKGTVDGATNPTLSAQYDAITIQSDGVQYYLLSTV